MEILKLIGAGVVGFVAAFVFIVLWIAAAQRAYARKMQDDYEDWR